MLEVFPLEPFQEVLLIKLKSHGDTRGFFVESYNTRAFQEATGLAPEFVQDNHSRSARGVLRGIHYQLAPHAQGKLVRALNGAVFDVAVDLRRSSPTFGKWASCTLRDMDGLILWIPPGFGHAFLVLEDNTDFLYKTTDFFAPECEAIIAWNDPDIGIQWPEEFTENNLRLSDKDQGAPQLRNARVFD